MQSHLFFGHGPNQENFVVRDQGTTNDAVYNKLERTHQFIHPMNVVTDNKPIEKI